MNVEKTKRDETSNKEAAERAAREVAREALARYVRYQTSIGQVKRAEDAVKKSGFKRQELIGRPLAEWKEKLLRRDNVPGIDE